jgi:hypothetical protein
MSPTTSDPWDPSASGARFIVGKLSEHGAAKLRTVLDDDLFREERAHPQDFTGFIGRRSWKIAQRARRKSDV